MRRSQLAVPALLALALVLTGCTASAAPAESQAAPPATATTLPIRVPIVDPVVWSKTAVATGELGPAPLKTDWHSRTPKTGWIDRGSTFAVTTWGSSVCPDRPSVIEVISASEIVVEFDTSNSGCTFDLAPTVQGLTLPAEVTGRPINVSFRFSGFAETFPQAALE